MSKYLIVTRDLLGLVDNGGIGTACAALAEHFVREGHQVHVLWVPGSWVENHKKGDNIANWIKHYNKKGVVLIPLPNPDGTKYSQEDYYYALSHRAYDWCKDKDYDAIIVHEWGAIGGHLAAGRKQGKVKSPVVTWCHSPTSWHVMGDQLCPTPQVLNLDAIEMMSIRWADAVVAPSKYLLDWLDERGVLPENRFVVRNFPTEHMMEMGSGYQEVEPIKHIVYFGRLERRKGLDLFVNAVLPLMEEYEFDVTFLGKNSAMEGIPSVNWIENAMETAQQQWRIEMDKSQPEALDLISQPGTLVVMPSRYENYPYTVMEAMQLGVPMVTCNTGGIPEMVNSKVMLADPTATSVRSRILAWLMDSQLCLDSVKADLAEPDPVWTWDQVFEFISQEEEPSLPLDGRPSPYVSIIITTYNRPVTFERALRSACEQDYPFTDIIVVDDHSSEENKAENERIVDAYYDKYNREITYIYKPVNEYLGPARNTGVDNSIADYVVFLDDDNVLYENAVSTFVQAVMASGAHIAVSPLRVFRDVPENIVSDYYFTGELAAGFFQNKMGDAMSIWEREIFDVIQYSDDRAGHEDWELLVRAALRGFRIFPLVDPIFLYQQALDGMLISGDVVKNIRRSMRPWHDESYTHYTKQLINEIAFSMSRQVAQQQYQMQQMMKEAQQMREEIHKLQGSGAGRQIMTPTEFAQYQRSGRR